MEFTEVEYNIDRSTLRRFKYSRTLLKNICIDSDMPPTKVYKLAVKCSRIVKELDKIIVQFKPKKEKNNKVKEVQLNFLN